MKKRELFLFLSVMVIVFNISCNKNPVNPTLGPTNCTYPPGNRNFSWSMDTVAWFPSTVGGIWAFSDSDAYLMGNIFQWTNSVHKGYIGLHWDGHKWNTNINGTVDEIKHVANDVTGDDHYLVSVGNWSINPPKPALGEFNNQTKKWKGYQYQIEGELRSVWTDGKGFFIAVGDNGMVYTKDGYTSDWIYTKVPTDFNFVKVTGITKSEVYALGGNYIAGRFYHQIWRVLNNAWTKLFDNLDTVNTPIKLPEIESIYTLAAFRCSISDSLYLYLTGYETFKLSSFNYKLRFNKINLSSRGLLFSNLGESSGFISLTSPNDYWIGGYKYYLYHWNGENYQKIEPISILPYGQLWGEFTKIKKSLSGKIWIILETDSQVYTVIQGTP